MNNSLISTKSNEFLSLLNSKKVLDRLTAVIPEGGQERVLSFVNRIMTEAKRNPKIVFCSASSIIDTCVSAAQLNLNPDSLLGHCYFIPRKDSLTLMLGYKGLLKMAYRGVKGLQHVEAHVVYAGEDFECQLGSKMHIFHMINFNTQQREDQNSIIAAYAILTYENGNKIYEVASKSEIDAIKKRSQSAKSGFSPWSTDFAAMAKKTVIKRILKTCDLQTENIQRAISIDDQNEYKYCNIIENESEDEHKKDSKDFLGVGMCKEAEEFFKDCEND